MLIEALFSYKSVAYFKYWFKFGMPLFLFIS